MRISEGAVQASGVAPEYDVVVIGAGVAGIYQIKCLIDMGLNATVLERDPDLGGTWYRNRYPGARFDSESYTYGYSFSREVLDEWHWKERFSAQPDTLEYLNFVAKKFDLKRHMQFNCTVSAMSFDQQLSIWRIEMQDGREITSRLVITGIGILSTPTLPRIEGIDHFQGQAFHTYYWPFEPVELENKRVGVIGTGATGIQVIAEIADKVSELIVFQRRPNWSAPLNNSPISDEEMAQIRARYDEIFENCANSPGGFEHVADRRGFHNFTRDEREAFWDKLYDEPGFSIWLANFPEVMMDEEANAELSEYIAKRIRQRVNNPETAEKLIPRDHGFGVQRLPLETRYLEAYNRGNVRLVDISETPIERIAEAGIVTTAEHVELDVIVYATGFDAITGAYDRIDIRGSGGQCLKDKWRDNPKTYLGVAVHGFPNMLMITGPQSGSAATNLPRGIETCVNWLNGIMQVFFEGGFQRMEPSAEAEKQWTQYVANIYGKVLTSRARAWFNGYNSNVKGRESGKVRQLLFNGGALRYAKRLREVAESEYRGFDFQ